MKKKRKIHWGFKLVGLILIGILANGLWDTAIGPVIMWLVNTCFDLMSLAFHSYSNSAYKEIAQGLHEGPSTTILGVVTIVFVGAMILPLLYGPGGLFQKIKKYKQEENIDKSKLFGKIMNNIINTLRLLLCVILLMTLPLCSRMLYINKAITQFNHAFRICSPFLGPEEEEVILSDFAQIQCKEDYAKIMEKFELIASENGAKINKFPIK